MNKKASWTTMLSLILLLGAFAIVFSVQALFAKEVTRSFDRVPCYNSVLTQASFEFVGTRPFNIYCPEYEVHIGDNRIQVHDGDKTKNFKVLHNQELVDKYSFLTEDMVYQVISEELRWCWWQFHEGNLDIFKTGFLGDILDSGRTCFYCNQITFDLAQTRTFDGLVDFMKLTNMRGTQEKYYDFITQTPPIAAQNNGKTHKQLMESANFEENIALSSEVDYSILFVKQGGGNVLWDGDYLSWVVPTTQAANYCGTVVYPTVV